jgi:hypothetical protein
VATMSSYRYTWKPEDAKTRAHSSPNPFECKSPRRRWS